MISWRYASADDLRRYYGEQQVPTVRAVVVCIDEDPRCVIGVAIGRGMALAFSEFKEDFRPHLRSITTLRALMAVKRMYAEVGMPLFAMRETENDLLARLGFEQYQNEVWKWAA